MYYVECELVLRQIILLTMFYMVFNREGLLWELVTLYFSIPLVPVMYPRVWVVTLISRNPLNGLETGFFTGFLKAL